MTETRNKHTIFEVNISVGYISQDGKLVSIAIFSWKGQHVTGCLEDEFGGIVHFAEE